jgi:CheY-like chemotaxis protein
VDDNSDARDILTTILQEKQAMVTQVASSIKCLQQLDNDVPDLIICDIGLPEINGYELMKYIRQRPAEKGGQVRAIALSAYAGQKYQRQAIAAGFQSYLTKPIEIVALLSTVQTVLKEPL